LSKEVIVLEGSLMRVARPRLFTWLRYLARQLVRLTRLMLPGAMLPGAMISGAMISGAMISGAMFSGFVLSVMVLSAGACGAAEPEGEQQNYLYVAVPGVRNYLEYGGHGLLVFDMDQGHRVVRRIATAGLNEQGQPSNVKGICASAQTGRLYISTLKTLQCLDLETDSLLWERSYEGGCDRMALSPDGRVLYQPSLEAAHWFVLDALTGDILAKLVPDSGAHNTVYGLDGRAVYLAGLRSPYLSVADTATHTITRQVGPFSASIRPFTVDGKQSRCYVCINELLGFEVGSIVTGEKLARVEVAGFKTGPVKRHGCPSHGVGLSPDETEVWVVDAHNQRLHVFDNTQFPPKQLESIALRDEPGWVTFSLDGRYAYPSTGEVIDRASRRIVAQLTDENSVAVQSEKMIELVFSGGKLVADGDQFGLGRVTE
jgi:hypothetical protein